MVIEVSNKLMFEEAIQNIDCMISEAVHEFQMGVLMDKYNYLQENGVIMEADEIKPNLKQRFQNLIEKIITAFDNAYKAAAQKIQEIKMTIRAKIEDRREQKAAVDSADEAEGKIKNIFSNLKAKLKSKKAPATEEEAAAATEEVKADANAAKEELKAAVEMAKPKKKAKKAE